jgi:hypothetical protein
VPSATETIISTMIVANIGTAATTFNIALRDAGETLANKHYIAKEVPVAANDSTTLTLGMALEATDVVTVAAGAADLLSFNLFGAEIDFRGLSCLSAHSLQVRSQNRPVTRG